jgi:hypothetical protein
MHTHSYFRQACLFLLNQMRILYAIVGSAPKYNGMSVSYMTWNIAISEELVLDTAFVLWAHCRILFNMTRCSAVTCKSVNNTKAS